MTCSSAGTADHWRSGFRSIWERNRLQLCVTPDAHAFIEDGQEIVQPQSAATLLLQSAALKLILT